MPRLAEMIDNLKNIKTINHFVPKKWGWESWIVNNDNYCGKVLFVKKGHRCSFHYHKNKHETFLVWSGKIEMKYSFDDCKDRNGIFNLRLASTETLGPQDTMTIEPQLRHSFFAVEDSYIVEFSTHHDDSDSYRIDQ